MEHIQEGVHRGVLQDLSSTMPSTVEVSNILHAKIAHLTDNYNKY